MGNADDLEEYDAELEMALKREYADVFPLFTYCVITDEATYLCNRLRMDCTPHAGVLLFDIRMEDVWVWDRNRPRRIIPRAQVYTTSDVTVEQLKEASEAEFEASVPQGLLDQLRAAEGDIDDDGDDDADRAPHAPGDAPAAGSDDEPARGRAAEPGDNEAS